MISPYINPNTKDYVLSNGNIENKNSLLTLSSLRLSCPRGSWPYNVNFGNSLQNSNINLNATTPKYLQQQVQTCLQDLITLGYIKKLVVSTPKINLIDKSATFEIVMIDNFSIEIRFVWSLIT